MAGPPNFDVQLESEQAYSPTLRLVGAGFVSSVGLVAHRHMLASVPGYSEKLYQWSKLFEERSPAHIGRTFGFSERLSAYTTTRLPIPHVAVDGLTFDRSHLVDSSDRLTEVGETFQRQFGDRLNILQDVKADTPLVFGARQEGSAYLQLQSHGGRGIKTRFARAGGRLAGTASRLDAELRNTPIARSVDPNVFRRFIADYFSFRSSQQIQNKLSGTPELAGLTHQPFHTKVEGQTWRNLTSRVRVEALEAFERPQRLFAEMGLGLKRGTWNSASGLVGGMLRKRVLPLVAGATALKYLDYKLGHVPSNALIDLPLKANVLRADLTNMVPGARSLTDFYADTVPGPQYGPLALPAAGAFAGGLYHYFGKVLPGKFDLGTTPDLIKKGEDLRKASARVFPDLAKGRLANLRAIGKRLTSIGGLGELWKHLGAPGKGAAIGLGLMLPLVPGMLGSRRTGAELRDIYSGQEPVPVRSGRWWELGSTAFEGNRIKEWRVHKSLLLKSRAEVKSVYGSEKDYWRHNPILHPIRWLRDPYYLERAHYEDRPYPVASPAFSNVPLIGPLLATTIGKVVKPSVRMHEEDWSGEEYSLYSTRLEPKGPAATPPPPPKDEFGLGRSLKQEAAIFAEYTGLYGFVAQSAYNALLPDYDKGREAFYQGSRQMTNFSRRYYEQELGAGIGPSASFKEHFGYTEPFRRFVQREDFTPQANEIPNTMPSWLPGDDYFVNLHVGDPYVKIDEGYARLPGVGYEALHPELEGVVPEDYPDIHKLAILADVAPYSREFNTWKQIVGKQTSDDTELRIEYEKILERVRQTKDSVVRMDDRQFSAPVEELEGTVTSASPGGFTLEEYPGRTFHFSSIGMSAADLTAAILGENNQMTRADAVPEVNRRHAALKTYLDEHLVGQQVRLTVPKGAAANSEQISAVVEVDGRNLNRDLIDQGYARYRGDSGGAETRAMHGVLGRTVGRLAEALAFEGDESALNPRRYVPSPAHTKLWQERTAISQYIAQEVAGTRMRRWHRPIHDFVGPYLRGTAKRLTGKRILPRDVQFRRDLNTLADELQYLRGKVNPAYTSQSKRTSVGANMFASPIFVASTLPDREAHYFRDFLREADPEKRAEILDVASPELRRTLTAQWAAQQTRIAQAEGKEPDPIGENGRLFNAESVEDYTKAETQLGYGDYLRSKEIADFFSRTGFTLPDEESPVWDEALDYEDVKLKIVQQEGYNAHDFNLFDDRAAVLWRKPYVDGAVRELTSGRSRSPEQLRNAVEQLMLASRNRNADIRTVVQPSRQSHGSVRVDVTVDEQDRLCSMML